MRHFPASIFSILLFGAAAQAQTVGSITAVNQAARGTPPGAAARTLSIGAGVVRNERIQTDAEGTAQVTFDDRSTMSVGRNSTVVVNNHVFDPNAGAGAQATSLLRGAMRYVGGGVSHGNGATITTPVATLGVRGGVASFELVQQGGRLALRITNHYGVVTINNSAGRFVLNRQDMQVIVDSPNSLPRALGFVDPGSLAAFDRKLTSVGRQQGGAQQKPTDAMMARQGVRTPRPSVETPPIDLQGAVDDATRRGVRS